MNCLLYARVSTDRQAQKDLSIPAQLSAMKELATKNKWKVVGHFIDEGESAKTANRPELKKLIQYCKEKKNVDMVVVHKIDRLARNLVDYATIKAILKQKGIKLVSVSEQFEDNPVGHLLENIIASISEWYSANLGEEIKKSNLAKLKRGEWPHMAPIGYKSVKGDNNRVKHIPNEEKTPLVRQAYDLFASGNYSLKSLCEEMHSRGLKTKYGRAFSPESMKTVLTNRFYIGRLYWKGREFKGIHEPIVSNQIFYQAQEVLRKRGVDTGEKGKLQFLLRGTAYCQVCNRKLTGEVHPRGSYYRCAPNHHSPKCSQPYTPVKSLDAQLEAIYERLKPKKKLLELLKCEMKDIAERRKKIAFSETKSLEKRIADLENKEMKLLDEMLSGKTERSICEKMQKKYSDERKSAEARLSQLQVDYDDPLDFLDKSIVVSSMISHLHKVFDYEKRKNLLKAIFEKIYVVNREIVDVKLNLPFSLFLGRDIEKMFDKRTSGGTKEDIFEQLVQLTLSEQYSEVNKLVNSIFKDYQVNR